MLIAILLIRSHVQLKVMYMHQKLLCDFKPNFIVLIVKIEKTHRSHKTGSKKPNASAENRTQNVSVTAHHLYHRPKDVLPETHYIGELFKSQFDSLVFYL